MSRSKGLGGSAVAQTVLQVCNPPVTCPLHLQRRNENCPATSSLGAWGELGAPEEFPHGGTGTKGSGQRRGDPPQSRSPLCSSESLSCSSEEPAGGCKEVPHQLTLMTALAVVLPSQCCHHQTTLVLTLCAKGGAPRNPTQPRAQHNLHVGTPKPIPHLPGALAALTTGWLGHSTPQLWAPRQYHPGTHRLQTHPCWVAGIHHSRSSVSSRCSGHRGGHCPPGYSTSRTTSAPGLEAKRRVRR